MILNGKVIDCLDVLEYDFIKNVPNSCQTENWLLNNTISPKFIKSMSLEEFADIVELEKDYTRRDLLYNFENILDSLNQERRNNIKNQVNIFDAFANEEEVKDTSLALKKSNIDITKKELLDKCDVFLTVGRITDEQYTELVTLINEIEEPAAE